MAFEWNVEAKDTKGKYNPSLVEMEPLIRDICEVREYGCEKYGDPENWKNVPVGEYNKAFMRHAILFNDDPLGVDEESGIHHYKHCLCNLMFISWYMRQLGE